MLLVFVALVVADFLDPINYILTDSEYYGISVSHRAKCIILLVVICVGIAITMRNDFHHYCHMEYYKGDLHRYVLRPLSTELLTYLLFPCSVSYILNDWFISLELELPYYFHLFMCFIGTIYYTVLEYCLIRCTVWYLKNYGYTSLDKDQLSV